MRPRAIMVALLAGLVVAGCGGGDGEKATAPSTEVPPNFTLLEGPGYALAHPKGFKELPEQREEGGSTRSLVGAEGPTGFPPQVAVGRTARDTGSFGLAVEALKADNRVRRAEWKIVSEKPLSLEGAEEARMIEARYVEPTEAGDQPIRTIDVLVRTKAGAQLNVLLRAPESDFEASGLRKVPATLRIG